VMTWEGREITNVGDAVIALERIDTAEDARLFKTLFIQGARATSDHPLDAWPEAESSLGYITGYLGSEQGNQLREWMEIEHPIFGRRQPEIPKWSAP